MSNAKNMSIKAHIKYYDLRIEKLSKLLKRQKISSFIISKDENIYYLTGFYGKESKSILLITGDKLHFLANSIYLENTKKSIKNKNINIVCCQKDRFKKLGEILGNYDYKNVGFEGSNISFSDFTNLKKILSNQKKRLTDIKGAVERLRVIKDEKELSEINNACRITDKTFKSLLNTGSSGINELSEIELGLKIEELLVKNGSGGKSFDIVVAYGKNSSMPHHSPQNIQSKGGLKLFDFGCRYNNYCSDMTRTIFTGNHKKNDEFKKIYDIVLEAQLLAIESCREGITCGELDSIARKFIASKDYAEYFVHGLGHGIGLEVHEEPKIRIGSRTVLKENMVITIEPGIYIENRGGVRIEDMVIVRKDKCEVLNKSIKKFFIPD